MSLILSGTDGLSDIDGTAAAPAIRGTDANTGIFFGTDIIGFSEGGVEAARINADSQFVAAAGTAALPVITTTGDTNTGIFFPAADTIAFSEGGTESMRIDSSGNLVIGSTSSFDISPTGSGQYPQLGVWSSTNNIQQGWGYFSGANANGLNVVYLKSRSSTVGTNTAVVSGDAIANLIFRGADGTGYRNAAVINAEVDGTVSTGIVPGRLRFNIADTAGTSTERMRIDSSGNLLVGKTATGLASSGFEANASGMTASNSGAEAANFNRNTSDGTVIIFRRSSSSVGTIGVTTTATSFNTSSDYRLKEAITPMTGALAKVALLKPVTYKWKVDGSDGQGFIAHELAEVESGCVNGEKDAVDSDGNPVYQGVDTSFLVATLTAAIQEQQAIITALTARITALETPAPTTGTQA